MNEFVLEHDKNVICVEAKPKIWKLKEAELKADRAAKRKAEEDQLQKKADQGKQGEKKRKDGAGPSSERGTRDWDAEDFEHIEAPGDGEVPGE